MTVLATLRTGQHVPAFFDWNTPKKAGCFSRTAWKQDGLIVPEEAIPTAIVVLEQANVWNAKGLFEPVLDIKAPDPNWVVVANKYYGVFTREQTLPKPIKKQEE